MRQFASYWHFQKPWLRFKRYNAGMVRMRYTLNGNRLTIHHEPGLSSKEAWDEEMEIVRFTGDTLTWDYGTYVTLHRLP